MHVVPRLLLGFGFISVLLGFFYQPTPAFACSCAEASTTEQFSNATAVFIGTVETISLDGRQRSVDFDVSEWQKGSSTESVTVATGWGDADCGFDFETGKEYVVYAYGKEEQLSTSICSGTTLVDIVASPEPQITEQDDTNNSPAVLTVTVALIAFGAGALVMRLVRREI